MQVSVRYFAGLCAAAGVDGEQLDSDAVSLAALYEQLRGRHGWRFETSACAWPSTTSWSTGPDPCGRVM